MNPNKPVTIKLNKDFRTAYYHGGSQVHPALVTYVRKNRLGVTRVGDHDRQKDWVRRGAEPLPPRDSGSLPVPFPKTPERL